MVELLVALGIAVSPAKAPRIDTIGSADGSRSALVVPHRAGKAKLPLVVWLHGGIGANNPSKGLAAAAGFVSWADSGGFALLAPSAWPASPWWSSTALARIVELIRRAGATPGVDVSRVVLAGASDGGSGALWLAGYLAGRKDMHLRGVAVWSTDPTVLVSRGVAFDPASLAGLPVRWTAGGHDRLYPFEDVAQWWGRLQRSGAKLESHHDPMADHDLSFHQADLGRFPGWMRGNVGR